MLERTRGDPANRPSSLRANRPLSNISGSEADGSGSTHYIPRPRHTSPGSDGRLSPSPLAGGSRPMYTTDDAVIQTTGGFAASLAHRGSRRLAVGGLERARSLRRVASEGDLSESTGRPEAMTPNIEDVPLTAESARLRPSSRDFTFARGISPPPLISPPPSYRSPIRIQPLGEPLREVAPSLTSPSTSLPLYRTPPTGDTTPAPMYQTVEGIRRIRMTAEGTVQASSASVMQTAIESTSPLGATQATSTSLSMYEIPQLPVTEASLGDGATAAQIAAEGQDRSFIYATTQQSLASATEQLGSPFMTTEDRMHSGRESVSSYATAPPPVPPRDSRYGSVISASSSRGTSPIRYQLHDAAVPSDSESTAPVTAAEGYASAYETAIAVSGDEGAWRSSAYLSAISTRSPGPSEYTSTPPPPISRSPSTGVLSFRSDVQDRAETATHISEPDSDSDLIADLERRSTAGSDGIPPWMRRPMLKDRSTYRTAATHLSSTQPSGRTPLGTVTENTLYHTARDTAYATAPQFSDSEYETTAERIPG